MEKNKTLSEKITEQTMVPLGLIMVSCVSMVGVILWLANIQSTAASARDRIAEMQQDRQAKGLENRQILQDINQRLGRIEGMLDAIGKRSNR